MENTAEGIRPRFMRSSAWDLFLGRPSKIQPRVTQSDKLTRFSMRSTIRSSDKTYPL